MHRDVQEALEGRGLWPLPAGVRLAVGHEEAVKILGKQRIKEAAASVRFPGDKKAKPRSSWEPYVYELGDEHIVTCMDPVRLPKMGWQCRPAIDAAIEHVQYLKEHGTAWTPVNPVYDLDDWVAQPDETHYVDIEGTKGNVDRISVATATQCMSVQWNSRVESWFQEEIVDMREGLVAHYSAFDGSALNVRHMDCTMTLHRVLNPWRRAGLGYCAPLYVPGLMPFKHLMKDDVETYSLYDAAVLAVMWPKLETLGRKRRAFKAYNEDLRFNEKTFGEHYRPSVNGLESPASRAAGSIGRPFGGDMWDVISAVVGAPVRGNVVQLRHCLGYGIRQIYNGAAGLAPLAKPEGKDKWVRAEIAKLAYEHPAAISWIEQTTRQNRKDGYVTALDGRRAYGLPAGEARRFLIWAEIARRQKTKIMEG